MKANYEKGENILLLNLKFESRVSTKLLNSVTEIIFLNEIFRVSNDFVFIHSN